MSTRLMFKACLCLGLALFPFFTLFAQNDCNCNQKLVVELNSQCRYVLTKEKLGLKDCPDSYVTVLDNKPQNHDTIDGPGILTYGLFHPDGRVICWGNITVLSPYNSIVLDSVNYIKDTLPFIDFRFISTYQSYGVPGSPFSPNYFSFQTTSDGKFSPVHMDLIPNLGIPYFNTGACQTISCGIRLSASDEIQYLLCSEALKSNIFATIKRSWIAKGCSNQSNSNIQYIHIRRPGIKDLHWNFSGLEQKKVTFYYGDCTLNTREIPIESIYPVVGRDNLPINTIGLKFTQAVQNKIDTTCESQGITITRTYLIYD